MARRPSTRCMRRWKRPGTASTSSPGASTRPCASNAPTDRESANCCRRRAAKECRRECWSGATNSPGSRKTPSPGPASAVPAAPGRARASPAAARWTTRCCDWSSGASITSTSSRGSRKPWSARNGCTAKAGCRASTRGAPPTRGRASPSWRRRTPRSSALSTAAGPRATAASAVPAAPARIPGGRYSPATGSRRYAAVGCRTSSSVPATSSRRPGR